MAQPTLINGVNYSSPNIIIQLFGIPVVGVVSIEYNKEQLKENNYSLGTNLPTSRGYANVTLSGSIEMYEETYNAIVASSPSRDILDVAPFDAVIIKAGLRVIPSKDILRSVEFVSQPHSYVQNNTKSTVKLDLIIGNIEFNVV